MDGALNEIVDGVLKQEAASNNTPGEPAEYEVETDKEREALYEKLEGGGSDITKGDIEKFRAYQIQDNAQTSWAVYHEGEEATPEKLKDFIDGILGEEAVDDKMVQEAEEAFKTQFGREPTAVELSEALQTQIENDNNVPAQWNDDVRNAIMNEANKIIEYQPPGAAIPQANSRNTAQADDMDKLMEQYKAENGRDPSTPEEVTDYLQRQGLGINDPTLNVEPEESKASDTREFKTEAEYDAYMRSIMDEPNFSGTNSEDPGIDAMMNEYLEQSARDGGPFSQEDIMRDAIPATSEPATKSLPADLSHLTKNDIKWYIKDFVKQNGRKPDRYELVDYMLVKELEGKEYFGMTPSSRDNPGFITSAPGYAGNSNAVPPTLDSLIAEDSDSFFSTSNATILAGVLVLLGIVAFIRRNSSSSTKFTSMI